MCVNGLAKFAAGKIACEIRTFLNQLIIFLTVHSQ